MNNTQPSDNLPEKFTQKLSTLKQSLRLSTIEAQSMRERLSAYADMHSMPASNKSVPSPFVFSYKIFYSRAFVSAALILILVISTGTGVTYAAGNSLPGQTLYPVKVNVAEPIEGAVIAATGGTTGSATWQNTLARRRITEATTLAAENDLATSTQNYLIAQATSHIAQSEDDSAELAATGDTSGADEVRTDLDARLAAHAELLALIAPRLAAAGDATTTSQVAILLSDVNKAQAGVLSSRDGREATSTTTVIASSSTSSTTSSSSTTNATTTITIALATPKFVPTPSFRAKEARFFSANAHILALLPQASTTASTSPSDDKNDDASTTATTTITTVVVTASTSNSGSNSGSDSPTDNSKTTIEGGL